MVVRSIVLHDATIEYKIIRYGIHIINLNLYGEYKTFFVFGKSVVVTIEKMRVTFMNEIKHEIIVDA